ncbi:TetR family transcriptional regulator [Kingella kingae]|uniref:TetR family transcriptional regulator n=1 Tax=Kingella kingae TaxID=504 RepID=UPI002550913B|nr:TetR family transcriptional regulator [Kingella kingae]MDK4535994.1 TetR family transcriptional regulator [Kingella kingae]MDK4539172.1 TetR family transcriptional regulator [Kingella kingae]MDK4547107.1 TetR family transcriptional regulator [Kingella kingae]MDK4622958.1 TetR family transcriptional regulator [Kingella kingae]
MAKAGLGSQDVLAMCHAELMAWLDDVLGSLGVKIPRDDGTIVSKRLPKPL